MSEPAIFTVVRGGQTEFYFDAWAGVYLHRELVWGPADFADWLSNREPQDQWIDGCNGGAYINYDEKRLIWLGEDESLRIPGVMSVYQRMLQAAWPDYEVRFAEDGVSELATASGAEHDPEESVVYRLETISEASRSDDLYEDEAEDEEYPTFEVDEVRAWVTLIDSSGQISHRELECLSTDLLGANGKALEALRNLPSVALPREGITTEGMWLDESNRTVGFWGDAFLRQEFNKTQDRWEGWQVTWAEGGYADHCNSIGQQGDQLSEKEALAKQLPTILSTEVFDLGSIIGDMGNRLKGTATKAAGCLLMVVCFPLVIAGLVSGEWKGPLIAMVAVTLTIYGAFKVIEFRVKRSIRDLNPATEGHEANTVAGPPDDASRRERIKQLLRSASLPSLAEVEPLFPKHEN